MTPQRPRPPRPGRASGPRRPPAPRPAPASSEPRPAAPGPTTSRPATSRPGAPRPAAPRPAAPGAGASSRPGTAPTSAVPAAPAATPAPGSGTRDDAARSGPAAGAPGGGRRTSGSALVPRTGTGAFPVRPPVVSQGSAARFAERARARRRLAWRQILLVAGGVLVVAAVAWLLLLSPVLALEKDQVTVTGAGTVVAVDQVRAVVDAEDGTPLPRLDTARLRSELLDVPGVRDVTVSRDWPHGLTVALVSREPVAAVPESSDVAERADHSATDGDGEGFALVDEEGVQVGRADAPPEGLPVVEVPVGEARILTATLGVLEALPEDLLAAIGQVSAGTQDTVQFTLRDGATVEWGSAQDSALKVAVLQALRAAPETAGSTRYDVSAPTMPVVG